jgi:peroxiredoxin Q/BCP
MAKKKKTSKKKTVKKAAKKTKSKVKSKKISAKSKTATKAKKKTAKKPAKKTAKSQGVTTKTLTTPPTETPATSAKLGEEIPPLTLENTDGYNVNLSDLATKNRHLVLYFYPKDDTPGCTKEACDFRDNLSNLSQHGATVVGVSPDSKESHQNFVNKYGINYTLLADPNHQLAEKMGVWKAKQFMGNSYMGVERSTFLFTDGKLKQIWMPVNVDGHVTEILETIEENQA